MEEQAASPPTQIDQTNFVIKRHPIGLVFMYIQSALALVALGALGFILAPDYLSSASDGELSAVASLTALFVGLIVVFMFIATVVYRRNQITVTDHDLQEINQRSLLARKVSRLEMNDIEDVTCEQKGLVQSLFGYGKLTVETAGAIDNFIFIYCPRPTFYAGRILQARARFTAQHSKD